VEKRRQLIIEPGFQLRMALGATGATVILVNLVLLTGFLPASPLGLGPLSFGNAVVVALTEALVLLLVWRTAVHTSHRVAGPIHRVKRALAQLADGDLSVQVNLRGRDFFHDLADAVNHLAKVRRDELAQLREMVAALETATADQSATAELVARLRKELDQFDRRPDQERGP
jgi:methyl-accepting chemotaxis protein